MPRLSGLHRKSLLRLLYASRLEWAPQRSRVRRRLYWEMLSYVGYERLETPGQCPSLNALYDQLWVYYNLFQTVLHLAGKEVVDVELRRQWDHALDPLPMTPGHRHPVLEAAIETHHPLRRDEPSTATGSHLPRIGTAVAASQRSTESS